MIDTITTKQLAERLQIGQSKAQEVMRGIKAVSDTLGISGLIHEQDYAEYLRQRLGSTEKKRRAEEKEIRRIIKEGRR